MSDRYEMRKKGVMAYRLNSESLAAVARTIIEATYGPLDADEDPYVPMTALVATKEIGGWGKHKLATLGTEGVGEKEDKVSGLVPLSVRMGNRAYDLTIHLHPRILVQHLAEQEDLADFVRVFGDRLDDNLALWQSAISGVDQTEALLAYLPTVTA